MENTNDPVPKSNDGKEQDAFEAWASGERYDMTTHPMHWLFLNERTYAARQGWKAALEYVNATLAASIAAPAPDARADMVARVDAAMVAMAGISPPLRRSECEKLICAALSAAPVPEAKAEQVGVIPGSHEWAATIEGLEVSMDVSTGEDDAGHRVFGTVCEVMLASCGAGVDTILAIEESRNFIDAADKLDAARWRALLGSARIQMQGSAGLEQPASNNYAHLGMEIWTSVDCPPDLQEKMTKGNDLGRRWLTTYADIAIKAQEKK